MALMVGAVGAVAGIIAWNGTAFDEVEQAADEVVVPDSWEFVGREVYGDSYLSLFGSDSRGVELRYRVEGDPPDLCEVLREVVASTSGRSLDDVEEREPSARSTIQCDYSSPPDDGPIDQVRGRVRSDPSESSGRFTIQLGLVQNSTFLR